MPANDRGGVSKYTHGASIVSSAVPGYYVLDDEEWVLSSEGPAEGYVAYWFGEEVVAADNPQGARIALIGDAETPVIRNIPTDVYALGALTHSRASAATYMEEI